MLTIKRKLANGDEVETTIADGQATDVISRPPIMEGLGASVIVLKPRPLTEAELLLQCQHEAATHLSAP